MAWIRNAVLWLVSKIGIRPTLNKAIDVLEDKAVQTDTKWDDAGVQLLRGAINVDEYTLFPILKGIAQQGIVISKSTATPIDDALFYLLLEVAEKGKTDISSLSTALIHALKKYAALTDNEVDDTVIEFLETILKSINVIK